MKPKTLVCLSLIALVTFFKIAAHAQTFSNIHGFENGDDGSHPHTGVTWKDGVLYGTTSFGPQNSNGAVFQLSHTYEGWTLAPLYQFPSDHNRSRGADPGGRVVFGPDGHLYDNTAGGGASGYAGVVFNLIPQMSTCKTPPCSWKENVLYSFLENPSGTYPSGDLVFDQQGNIYGTTQEGGARGGGSVYKMTKSGSTWMETPVWNFSGYIDGDMPQGGVILDGNGNLFGTTWTGGKYGYGTVFELSYINGQWVETTLHTFQGGSDGGLPQAGLLLDGSGNLYGSTSGEGPGNVETVFELMPSGNTYSFTVLYSFPRSDMQRCGPAAALTMDAAGNLYGTTQCNGANGYGNVFELANTQNGWVYTSLHDFDNADGAYPYSNVTIGGDGNLYGTTAWGGDDYFCLYGCGTIWMIKP